MTKHFRLAAAGTIATIILAVPATVVVYLYTGGAEALAFGYGVGVGLVAFVSIAISAALMISGEPSETKLALGFGVYMARLMFAAIALGLPIMAGAWPILPMVGGVVAVYVLECVALLVGAWKMSAEMQEQVLAAVRAKRDSQGEPEIGEVPDMERRAS